MYCFYVTSPNDGKLPFLYILHKTDKWKTYSLKVLFEELWYQYENETHLGLRHIHLFVLVLLNLVNGGQQLLLLPANDSIP